MLTQLATIRGQFKEVASIAFCPQGSWVAIGGLEAQEQGDQGHPRVLVSWSLSTDPVQLLVTNAGVIHSLAFSPGGKYLLVGETRYDHTSGVRLVEVATGRDAFRFKGVEGSFYVVATSKRGNRIAMSTIGRTDIWDLKQAKRIDTIAGWRDAYPGQNLDRDKDEVCGLAFSPDGNRLVIVGSTVREDEYGKSLRRRGLIMVKEICGQPGTPHHINSHNLHAVAFSPDGADLVVANHEGDVELYGAATLQLAQRWPILEGLNAKPPAMGIAFHPDGRRVFAVGGGSGIFDTKQPGRIQIWDRSTGEKGFSIEVEWTVTALTLSPEGTRLVTAHEDGTVIAWAVE